MNEPHLPPSTTAASQAVIAARSAQPGGPSDLDSLIAAAEQAVIRRDELVRQRATELATRLHLGGSRPRSGRRGGGVGAGLAAGGLGLARLLLGSGSKAPKGASSRRDTAGGMKLPWARIAALAWPLIPSGVRGRVSPATAATVAGFVVPVVARALRSKPPPVAAARVDLARYAGRWYEVARLPTRHQKRCTGDVSATYSFNGERGRVMNRCRTRDGGIESVMGVARVVSGSHGAKLKICFAPRWMRALPWVWADYWILRVDPDYRAALVGTPDRDQLWLLSRTPRIDDDRYTGLLDGAKAHGFDTSRLIETSQGV